MNLVALRDPSEAMERLGERVDEASDAPDTDDLSTARKANAVRWWITHLRSALRGGDMDEATRLMNWSDQMERYASEVADEL